MIDFDKMTDAQLEAYVQGLYDVLRALGVQDGHCKHYDPLTVEGDTLHSYVYDLTNGGRRHSRVGKTQAEVCQMFLDETIAEIKKNYAEIP
jgi:hypothetical protein